MSWLSWLSCLLHLSTLTCLSSCVFAWPFLTSALGAVGVLLSLVLLFFTRDPARGATDGHVCKYDLRNVVGALGCLSWAVPSRRFPVLSL